MKELIILSILLIVGCDNSTEPLPEDCAGVAGGSGICDVPVMGYQDATAGYMTSGDIPTFKIYDASENAYYDAIPSENIPWADFGINLIESLTAITKPL